MNGTAGRRCRSPVGVAGEVGGGARPSGRAPSVLSLSTLKGRVWQGGVHVHDSRVPTRRRPSRVGAGAVAAVLLGAALVTGIAAASGRQGDTAPAAEDVRTYVVLARTRDGRFEFEPRALPIEPGDRVVWLNVNDFHSTTAYHPDNGKPKRIPPGTPSWDSGIFGLEVQAASFAHRFRKPGVYDYYCRPHEAVGMVGRIVVGAAADAPADLPGVPASTLPPVAQITGVAREVYRWEGLVNVPLWLLVESDSAEEAAVLADRLVRAFHAGRDGAAALRQQLRDPGAVARFEQNLGDLARAARLQAFEAAMAAADRLRDQLAVLR